MNRALAFMLLAFSAITLAQAPQIKSGATIYIEPADGYETELAAAMMKKHVPLVVVLDQKMADYILRVSLRKTDYNENSTSAWSAISASIAVIDARSSQIVFAAKASSNRGWVNHLADSCAEQLAQYMEKHKQLVQVTNPNPSDLKPTPPSPAQASANIESTPSAQSIATPIEQAATDDAETQFHLGTLYETGKGVPQDYAQAVLWYHKAAEQNLAIAQNRLGVLYANGVGVPLEKAQSAAWFQKAADQGYVYAQYMLGLDYLTGEGVQLDYAEAYFWLDVACYSNAPEIIAGERATMRDTAATYLTPADLSRVQERVRKRLEDHPAKPQ
jgi:hypothetical protein